MIATFEVDCGQALPGHRLVVRGLCEEGRSDDLTHREYSEHYEGKPVHRMVSLIYSLVPGLERAELEGSSDIEATARLDPPADPAHWDAVLTFGGYRDALPGLPATNGAFGPFVFPEQTRRVEFELRRFALVASGTPADAIPADDEQDEVLGTLDVDVAAGTARWLQARPR